MNLDATSNSFRIAKKWNKRKNIAKDAKKAAGKKLMDMMNGQLIRNINALPRINHRTRGHNTGSSLKKTKHGPFLSGDTWTITMSRKGGDYPNPKWVEAGTQPHQIVTPYFGGKYNQLVNHPGARPTWFWRRAKSYTKSKVSETLGSLGKSIKKAVHNRNYTKMG